jgi:hypothetical protein
MVVKTKRKSAPHQVIALGGLVHRRCDSDGLIKGDHRLPIRRAHLTLFVTCFSNLSSSFEANTELGVCVIGIEGERHRLHCSRSRKKEQQTTHA